MSVNKLLLEEAIEDSPQMHNFLTVFEEDASLIKQYTEEFFGFCDKIHKAQSELAAASHGLAQLMKKYTSIKFPLEKDASYMMSTFPLLAEYMEEVSTMQQILASQVSDTLIYPISRFLSADLEELFQLQNLYKMVSDEHELAVQKYMKLPKRCSERLRVEAVDEVFQMRKKLHRTSLHYFSAMNLVQYKRQFVFLEAIAGHLQAHLSFFKIGSDYIEKQELETVHSNTKGLLLCGQRELDLERTKTADLVASIEESCPDSVYQPEPLTISRPISTGSAKDIRPAISSANPHLTHKSGYLMLRTRPGLLHSKWDREFFYTQNGNLMRQGRLDVAGCLLLDLGQPGLFAEPCDADDRRNAFQIAAAGKKPVVLQAENATERDEWISAITNILVTGGGFTRAAPSDVERAPLGDRYRIQGQLSTGSVSSLGSPSKSAIATSGSASVGASAAAAAASSAASDPESSRWFDDIPIQFDLPHLTETLEKSGALFAQQQDQQQQQQLTVTGSEFAQTFGVRFTGSVAVPGDKGQELVSRTMHRIFTARAVHNIFKSTDYQLVVSDRGLWLLEPGTRLIRCEFLLEDISYWASHSENTRLLGLICRSRSVTEANQFTCFTFECDCAADKVCSCVRQATRIAYQAFVDRRADAERRNREMPMYCCMLQEETLLLSNIDRLPDMTPSSEQAPSDETG